MKSLKLRNVNSNPELTVNYVKKDIKPIRTMKNVKKPLHALKKTNLQIVNVENILISVPVVMMDMF